MIQRIQTVFLFLAIIAVILLAFFPLATFYSQTGIFVLHVYELESITPSEKDNQDISQESVQEKEDLASEKLIKVYIQQGYYQKAIEAYEKLSLKYPEKSDYFAEQIEKLKPYIHKQKK